MKKIVLKEKIGYGLGDTGTSIVWQSLMLFLANFYTDTFGISPTLTGIIYIIVMMMDAFVDIAVGLIADRTNTRWGKYRPYLLFACIPFCIFAAFLFFIPPVSVTLKAIYALSSFMLMMIMFSLINVPYSALSSAMSNDSEERTSLMGFRFTGAYLGGFIVQAFLLSLVAWFAKRNSGNAYFYTMMIMGGICFITFLSSFLLTKERVAPKVSSSIKQDFRDLTRNKPWLLLFAISIMLTFFFSMRNIIIKYYFDYYIIQKEIIIPFTKIHWNSLSAFYVIGTCCVIVSVLLTGQMSKKFGKRKLFIVSNVLTIIILICFYFVKPNQMGLLFTTQIIFCLSMGPMVPLIWSMYADSIDYSEWKFGRRAAGLITAASLFANKTGFAIASSITLLSLSLSGYTANIAQSPESLGMILKLFSIYPAIGGIFTLILFHFYKLDERKMNVIKKALSSTNESRINSCIFI